MSESCNGYSVADGVVFEGAGGSIEPQTPKKEGNKSFPPGPAFPGFIPYPRVNLTRYDITPYLNGSRKAAPTGKLKRGKSKSDCNYDVHQRRLSQKCVVNVTRDDLEALKASWCRRNTWKELVTSDSEESTNGDMTYRCNICNKSYASEKKLLNHQRKKHIIYTDRKPMKHVSFSDHVIIHEVKEYHKCRKCPKIFEEYRSLKLHTKQQHKKRKCYICNYCSKSFAERMIFKIHIKLHCDVCGELFPSKAKCLVHKRNVCRVIKLHKCKICDESFYNVMDLKDHGYEHKNECFVCDICKDHFDDKCSIAHHILFLHAKKRPESLYMMRKMGNERLYLCNFCDVSSVEKSFIENHIQNLPDLKNRAMTGYKDYYFCEHCMKKFPNEQEMLQHKWTHFLKKSENSNEPLIIKPETKVTYNVNKIPLHFQPKVVLTKLNMHTEKKKIIRSKPVEFGDITNIENVTNNVYPVIESPLIEVPINEIDPQDLKKAIVDPKSKKTLISKHQCELCGKYFSTNYCLNRHITTVHIDFENLRCRMCEETFVWPSLLRAHRCIRLHHPEMPFDDARPEVHFDNLPNQYGIEDLTENDNFITDNDDYLHSVDFEIPAPIVEFTECDSYLNANENGQMNQMLQDKNSQLQSLGYKLIEVPIEF